MTLIRTRTGWAESVPECCPNGHRIGPGTALVGWQACDCGQGHRTHHCLTCQATMYLPPLGAMCRARQLDER